MSATGRMVLPAEYCKEPNLLRFALTCAEAGYYGAFPFGILLQVDGCDMGRLEFQESQHCFELELKAGPRKADMVVELRSEATFVPSACGLGTDARTLSVRMSRLQLLPLL